MTTLGDKRTHSPGRGGGHGGHDWMMIACCIPMPVIAIVLATGVAGADLVLAAIMCSAMLWMMMRGMSRPGGH